MNTLILFLSRYVDYDNINYYKTENGDFETTGNQTNEPFFKYIKWFLERKKEKIDRVIYICSDDVLTQELAIINMQDFIKNDKAVYENIKISNSPKQEEIFKVTKDISSLLNPEDNIFIDITGGFRDTIMIMIQVIRIMKVQGINAEKIIYVNFSKNSTYDNPNIIYDRAETYNIFDLISGIDEFVNYGRVNKINDYYNTKGKIDPNISKVLKKLNGFSNSLSLCQSKDINNKIKNIYEEIDKSIETVDDTVYLLMVKIIKENYAKKVKPDSSILDIVLWCIDKDLVMQSLAFFVDIGVIYLFENKIILISDEMKKMMHEKKEKEKKDYYSVEQYFFSEYLSKGVQFSDLNTKIPEKDFKEFANKYRKIRNWRNDIFHGKEFTTQKCQMYDNMKDTISLMKDFYKQSK